MDYLSFKTTYQINKKSWIIMDATGKKLGRLCSIIAFKIRGKHKPNFSPHLNCGDHIIVINSAKIQLSGKKWMYKKYIHYTGYPGGQKQILAKNIFKKNPCLLIHKAVFGMLPKNKLRKKLIKNLHIYSGNIHKHHQLNLNKNKLNKSK
ncbi:50S ribosomal protein L13 [Blattabacterium cuenoti]|uniref:50S ribosomal protein L13 n=1 Tax=Blattabacterium cuenoti TaxID=1653831 RepID=UPI00163C33A7|nr:50S ribosomal protein L13 [Blattabacterium cuenoti]